MELTLLLTREFVQSLELTQDQTGDKNTISLMEWVVIFNKKFYDWKLLTTRKWSKLTNGGNYKQEMDWKVHFDGDAYHLEVLTRKLIILYIEELFDQDPGYADRSFKKGDAMAVIGSFVLYEQSGFTPQDFHV